MFPARTRSLLFPVFLLVLLVVGRTATAAPGDVLYEESFETGDPWTQQQGFTLRTSAVSDDGNVSLLLYNDGTPVITASPIQDFSGIPAAELTLWWQQGYANSAAYAAETGDDLAIDYQTVGGAWQPLGSVAGGQATTASGTFSATLPQAALHSQARFRVRNTGTTGGGDGLDWWFIDSVAVTELGPFIGTGTGLSGNYCNRPDTNGARNNVCDTNPDFERVDPTVDFSNGDAGWPPSDIDEETYNARWTGEIQAQWSQDYTFHALHDDGVRIWVDGTQVIDNYSDQDDAWTDSGTPISLQRGQKYEIVIEWYENTGEQDMTLAWSSASTPSRTVVPQTQLYPEPGTTGPDPVAWHRLDESAYDGSTGEILDATGNGNTGRTTGTVTSYPSGDPGAKVCSGATVPDNRSAGTIDAIDTGLDMNDALGNAGSINFWFRSPERWRQLDGPRVLLDASEGGSGTAPKYFYISLTNIDNTGGPFADRGASLEFGLEDDADEDFRLQTDRLDIDRDTWVHIGVTWDLAAEQMSIYVDGVQEASRSMVGVSGDLGPALRSIYLGDNRGSYTAGPGTGWSANGRFDEARFYDEVIGAARMQADRDATHPCTLTSDQVQAGRVTLNDTASDPTFNEVCFDQPFAQAPMVFALNDSRDPQPAGVRIRNVTASGFEIAQVEPPGEDGTSGATTVDFVAVVPGSYSLPGGTQIVVDSLNTTDYQSAVQGGDAWANPAFPSAFDDPPAVLGQVQTMNNESASPAPPGGPSMPWLKTTIRDVQDDEFDIALERAEVDDGAISQPETIGYLAIEAGESGSLTPAIDFESIRSDQDIRGWANGCFDVPFAGSYGRNPLVVATQNTRNGPNGGWLRRCALDTGGVGLRVDEDRDNDGERSHTTERAGILVLSGSFGSHQCAGATLDHFALSHDGAGINCRAENVVLRAEDAGGSLVSDYSGSVDLLTTTGNGDWSIDTANGSLTGGGDDDGAATYTFDTSDGGEVTLDFANSHAETLNIDATDGSATDDDTEGDITFRPWGFEFAPDPIPAQVAGRAFDLTLTAVGELPSDPGCNVIQEYDGNRDLKFWFDHENPGSGGTDVTVDASAIATSEAAATDQTVAFTNGEATVAVDYPDAGEIQLHAQDDSGVGEPPSGSDDELVSGGTIGGGTNPFVVRPFAFSIESGDADFTASDASGSAFVAAGSSFNVTVEAVVWQSADDGNDDGVPDSGANLQDNAVTPNFGDGSPAPTVDISHALLAPTGTGTAPGTLTGGNGIGGFTNGVTTTPLAFDEVGIIALTANLTDYLGEAGVNVTGTRNDIGRFIPARLDATGNTPALAPFCGAAPGFAYLDQALDYATDPAVTVTARNAAGDVTENYGGAFWQLPAAFPNRNYADASGSAATLAEDRTDTTIDWADGGADGFGGSDTATISAERLTYQRNGPEAPFAAAVDLVLPAGDLTDGDGVCNAGSGTCNTNGGDSGDAFTFDGGGAAGRQPIGGPDLRFGRLRLDDAFGPEVAPVTQRWRLEYWTGDTWAVNTDDSCTTLPLAAPDNAVQLDEDNDAGNGNAVAGDQPVNLSSGDDTTRILDELDVMSGDVVFGAGVADVRYAAPGAGDRGWIEVRSVLAGDFPHLLADTNGDGNFVDPPQARVTFGVFAGEQRQIYLRELFPAP